MACKGSIRVNRLGIQLPYRGYRINKPARDQRHYLGGSQVTAPGWGRFSSGLPCVPLSPLSSQSAPFHWWPVLVPPIPRPWPLNSTAGHTLTHMTRRPDQTHMREETGTRTTPDHQNLTPTRSRFAGLRFECWRCMGGLLGKPYEARTAPSWLVTHYETKVRSLVAVAVLHLAGRPTFQQEQGVEARRNQLHNE